jgi:hypothetical protein
MAFSLLPTKAKYTETLAFSRHRHLTLGRWAKIVLLAAVIFLFGCQKHPEKTTATSGPVFATVQAQIKALNQRNAAAALALMHPEAPGLDQTRKTTEQVTATYDLIFMLQNMSLESVSENEATVRFTQITQKVSGPAFRNNRVAGLHTLRKHRGAWRLYYTQVLQIDYLDN